MTAPARAVLDLEVRKLTRAYVVRIATLAVLVLVTATTWGGYAAAVHTPASDLGRKSAVLMPAPGWAGFTGLAVLGAGVAMLLASGIVMSWTTGREFADGTVVGLFGVPPRTGTIGLGKSVATLAWVAVIGSVAAVVVPLGGLVLGLPIDGAIGCGGVVGLTAVLSGAAASPVLWVATRWRGYLAGIGATLAFVVVGNLAAGLGLGRYVPWAVPLLWATPGSGVPASLLLLPVATALAGVVATWASWRRLEIGDR